MPCLRVSIDAHITRTPHTAATLLLSSICSTIKRFKVTLYPSYALRLIVREETFVWGRM